MVTGCYIFVCTSYDFPEEVKQGARSQYSDNMPYNSTAYDGAMNRVLKQCGAGSAWNGRGVQTFYYVNTGTGSLSCAKYELLGKQLIRKGLYDTGDLVVVRTIDEDGHSRYDFSDKEGHTVLSRQINGGNYDTYYVMMIMVICAMFCLLWLRIS